MTKEEAYRLHAYRTFTQKQIEKALRAVNAKPLLDWHPVSGCVLDENGSRRNVGVLDWMPSAAAWKAWLAEKRGKSDDRGVLPLSGRAQTRKGA